MRQPLSVLVQLQCPECSAQFWVIDYDYIGPLTPERVYTCTSCGRVGVGHAVIQIAPPQFLLQPHDHFPMTLQEFEHWVAILRENFPDHPLLQDGRSFVPCTPENSYQARPAVLEMRDGRGRARARPQLSEAAEWLENLGWMNTLTFDHKNGMKLLLHGSLRGAIRASCSGSMGKTIASGSGLTKKRALVALEQFFKGDTDGCLWTIAPVE